MLRRAAETHQGRIVVIGSTHIDQSYDRATNNVWVTGIVRYFDDKDGVGVIDSPDTPGGCWCHYSQIDIPGRKTLLAGQSVRFTFEDEVEQDGFVFRALRVQPSN